MSLYSKPAPTPGRLAANRQNAGKSSGPRPPEGKARAAQNSLKHGLYASTRRETMVALGEDAREFESLRRDVVEEWRPSTATEAGLVRNLAELLWRQERVRRAEEGLAARRVELLEIERARRRSSAGRQVFEGSEAEVLIKGLRNVKDSPGKFEEGLDHLLSLLDKVDRRDFSKYPEQVLQVLYGKLPTWRGARIGRVFRNLVKPARAGEPDVASPDEETVSHLASLLRQEIHQMRDEYELYKREHVEITPALRDACLAPSQPEWTLLIRQENSLLRQIDRTVKLLMALKRKRDVAAQDLAPVRSDAGEQKTQEGRAQPEERDKKEILNAETNPLSPSESIRRLF